MTLAEISRNGLSLFPQIGLVIFLVVFAAVTVRALRRSRNEVSRWAGIPLEDDAAGKAAQEGSAEA